MPKHPKIVAIGDSLTQGIQSGGISNPKMSYPALIAKALGLNVPDDFRVPEFPMGGLPLNIEKFLKFMVTKHPGDADIDFFEWGKWFLPALDEFTDELEKCYESGEGSKPDNSNDFYHNLAIAGYRVYDSFNVNSNYCLKQIKKQKGNPLLGEFGPPSASMYRIAHRVLNPTQDTDRDRWTQIDNLKHIHTQDNPVDILILFLGANDCLRTVAKLKMKDMEKEKKEVSGDSEKRRKKYNLTSAEVFEDDYREMVRQISEVISDCTQVFVGTIPHVTIPPIAQGISKKKDHPDNRRYYPDYGPFFSPEEGANEVDTYLSKKKVKIIEQRINSYNDSIQRVISKFNKKGNWHIVDIYDMLDDLAIKRYNRTPEGALKQFFEDRKISDRRLLEIKPTPSVLRYESSDKARTQGGIFSLDSIHPTTVGYGLIAEEFLRKMQEVGVPAAKNAVIDWQAVIEGDTLLQDPPVLWNDVMNIFHHREQVWDYLFSRTWSLMKSII